MFNYGNNAFNSYDNPPDRYWWEKDRVDNSDKLVVVARPLQGSKPNVIQDYDCRTNSEARKAFTSDYRLDPSAFDIEVLDFDAAIEIMSTHALLKGNSNADDDVFAISCASSTENLDPFWVKFGGYL